MLYILDSLARSQIQLPVASICGCRLVQLSYKQRECLLLQRTMSARKLPAHLVATFLLGVIWVICWLRLPTMTDVALSHMITKERSSRLRFLIW